MENTTILTDKEFEIFNQFSQKLNLIQNMIIYQK